MSIASTPFEQQQWALQQLGDATRALREAERVLDQYQTNPEGGWERLTFHYLDTNNPHGVTKDQVGLGSVMNYGIATSPQAIGGTSNSSYMTPLRTDELIQDRLSSLTGIVGSITAAPSSNGYLQLDASVATQYSKTVATNTPIAVAPVAVDRMATIQLTLVKNATGSPAVTLGDSPGAHGGVEITDSADDSASGTYLYTFYVGYGVPLAYRVESIS